MTNFIEFQYVRKLGAVVIRLPQTAAIDSFFDLPRLTGPECAPLAFPQPPDAGAGWVIPTASIPGSGPTSRGTIKINPADAQHKRATPFASDYLLPAVQGNFIPGGGGLARVSKSSYSYLIGLLIPAVRDICVALDKVLPPNQKVIEVIGMGTDRGTLNVLIGLLGQAGFHATIASCDGSVRQGFTGPTAVLRAQGGDARGQFLQQLGSSLAIIDWGDGHL